MKTLILTLALLNACYMLVDGIYVLVKGKYIGPDKPGPWANLFYKLHINVFKLGPLFIIFGLFWFAFTYGLWSDQSWSYSFGLALTILTFWYIKVGTFISLITLIYLLNY